MTVSLEKKLEETVIAKKRYHALFVVASVLVVILISWIYNNAVLDYAVLDNVQIEREQNTNNIFFKFDVVKEGRIDFNYGNTVLTDRKQIQIENNFYWNWTAKGETIVSVRSRKFIFPHWDSEKFIF
jgi:hypothetical protein